MLLHVLLMAKYGLSAAKIWSVYDKILKIPRRNKNMVAAQTLTLSIRTRQSHLSDISRYECVRQRFLAVQHANMGRALIDATASNPRKKNWHMLNMVYFIFF